MTRYDVLAILKNEKDYISGEKISEKLGVSRAAVNLAVKALRAEGYDISSATNRGYKLENSPDILNEGEIMSYLAKERMRRILCIESVDSTNKLLKELAAKGAFDGQVVVADEQTAGRGRLGRSFISPKGSGVYISYLMRPHGSVADSIAITAHVAVAVLRAICNVCGIICGIKWVNDLVINKKKICGILTEMSVEGESGEIRHLVIGIGVNVSESKGDFPKDIDNKASSIFAETGIGVSRAALAAEIIKELDILAARKFEKIPEYLEEYRKYSVTVGKEVRVLRAGETKTGKALCINDDYSLAVQYKNGDIENVQSGEVSVRGLYDYL